MSCPAAATFFRCVQSALLSHLFLELCPDRIDTAGTFQYESIVLQSDSHFLAYHKIKCSPELGRKSELSF